jgi:hypothetical protein
MKKILGLCYAGLVASTSAIVVDDYQVAEAVPSAAASTNDLNNDLNWDYVYNYKGSSAVAVGDVWLLTARHVADDGGNGSLTIDEMVYTQQEIVYHPTVDGYAPDLALVRYDKVLPGYYDLYTGALPLTFEQTPLPVLMVGYGNTGVVYNDYWTRNGSGKGTKRWGSQEIDIALDDEFWMYFDKGQSDWEAGAGTGDSGGGVFFKDDDDIWKLAGINVAIKSKPGTSGLGFDRTVAVSMPYYADWVMDTMDTVPEPAAMGLMGFGTVGLFLMRAKRRRKLAGRSLLPIRAEEPLCDRFFVIEDTEAAEGHLCADYLNKIRAMISTSPLPACLNTLNARYHAVMDAVYGLFAFFLESWTAGKATVKKRFKSAAVRNLDAFLDEISWGRLVFSVKSGRAKASRAVKRGTLRSLDAFLEIIRWDHMVSLFGRRK